MIAVEIKKRGLFADRVKFLGQFEQSGPYGPNRITDPLGEENPLRAVWETGVVPDAVINEIFAATVRMEESGTIGEYTWRRMPTPQESPAISYGQIKAAADLRRECERIW